MKTSHFSTGACSGTHSHNLLCCISHHKSLGPVQGSHKRSHKTCSFHQAATQKERTLLFQLRTQNVPRTHPNARPRYHWPSRAMPGTAEVLEENQQVYSRAEKQQFVTCPRSSLTFTIHHTLRSSAVGSVCHNSSRNHWVNDNPNNPACNSLWILS